jgi:dihydroorotate dehydrogenase subfamily 2
MGGLIKKNLVLILALLGLIDASYLTYKHFFAPIEICFASPFSDCGAVLKSEYSVMFGLPVALWGAVHYLAVIYWFLGIRILKSRLFGRMLFLQTFIGVLFSVYYTYLQFYVIKALCPYCLASAVISFALYFVSRFSFYEEYRRFSLIKIWFFYQIIAKPVFFILPADFVHSQAMFWADVIGRVNFIKTILSRIFVFKSKALTQKIEGQIFENPIGLAAGYDYEGAFTQILPAIGFGFETVGTISFNPCEGNSRPRLGRLPKSKSLLVNKGFRNKGAIWMIKKLKKQKFEFPLGISIGRTNNESTSTLKNAVEDIFKSFELWEKSKVEFKYYELNISCPNLKKGVDFYQPANLSVLLNRLNLLKTAKPVFVKMPIELDNASIVKILETLKDYRFIKGVIFGNLQKDRQDPAFDLSEISKAGQGNFSGLPTYKKSNELIKLTYKKYKERFVIIGCGGVFSAQDAYVKIRSGASLIQMITGLVFEGPQIVSITNRDLVELLTKDGYKNIKEAVGADC